MAETVEDNLLMPSDESLGRVITAIDAYNARRTGAQRKVYGSIALVFVPYCAGLALIGYVFFLTARSSDENGVLNFIVALILAGALYGGKELWKWVWRAATDLQLDTRYKLFPEIFGFIKGLRYSNGATPRFMSSLPASAVLQYNRIVHDDLISGEHDGFDFELGECEFWFRQGKSESKTFQGMIFHSQAEPGFRGTLVISKNQTDANRFWFGGPADRHLTEVIAEDWLVRANHSIRSSNPRAAQALVDGSVGSSVRWIDRRWTDGVTRIVLQEKDIYLFVPSGKNFFELPPIGVDVDFREHIEPMIHELVALLATGGLIRTALAQQVTPATP